MKRSQFVSEDEFLGIYLKEISKYRPIKSEEEARLAVGIRKGNRADLEKLIKSNLRFVVSVARNYQNQGVPLTDLINEGNLGLIRAAKRFDEAKNFRFISYAVWWIRQAILQALADQSRVVKLPVNRVGVIHRISKTEEKLEQRFGRRPDIEEIAREAELDEENVSATLRIGNRHLSFESPLGEKGESSLHDVVYDEEAESPDEGASLLSFQETVDKNLDILSPREKQILKLYYGMTDGTPRTLNEIGRQLNVTRERVRQLKENALRKLKRVPSRVSRLKALHAMA